MLQRKLTILLLAITLACMLPLTAQAARYAILVSSEDALRDNSVLDCEFWYDLSATYQTLLANGYSDEDIYVFYGDQENFTSRAYPYYNFDYNIVDEVVSHDGVLAQIDNLATVMGPQDELFFWWFGHGRETGGDVDLKILDGSQSLLGQEIINHMSPLASCEIMINTCHSGCFINTLEQSGLGFMAITPTACDNAAYSNMICDSFHMEFPAGMNRAFTGTYPGLACGEVDADLDDDGRISFEEALAYIEDFGIMTGTVPQYTGDLAGSYLDEPGIRFTGLILNDTNTGNGNGRLDPGETIEARPMVFNTSDTTISGVDLVVSLLMDEECVSIGNDEVHMGPIGPGEIVIATTGFILQSSELCSFNIPVDLKISYEDPSSGGNMAGFAQVKLGSHLPVAIIDEDLHHEDGTAQFGRKSIMLGDGDWQQVTGTAGKSWFLMTDFSIEDVGGGTIAHRYPWRLVEYDPATNQLIGETQDEELSNYLETFYQGLAIDDRKNAPVAKWVSTRSNRAAQIRNNPNGSALVTLTGNISGLAFDRDNNHLWCIQTPTNSQNDYLYEYDVTNRNNPVLLQGPVTVPWPNNTTTGAGGLEYVEEDNLLIAVNSELGAMVAFEDLDPASGGGVSYRGMTAIAANAPYGLAVAPAGIIIGNQIGGMTLESWQMRNSLRPRTIEAYTRNFPNEVVAHSVRCKGKYEFSGDHYWEFSWRTADWTDPSLDQVGVINVFSNGTGREEFNSSMASVTTTVAPSTEGGWLHTMQVARDECVPNRRYDVDVTSVSFAEELTSDGNYFAIKRCLSSGRAITMDESLLQNAYPNPFNPRTELRFYMSSDAQHVNLSIYDVAGHHIKTLREGRPEAGWATAVWNGNDTAGRRVGTGVYLARLVVDGQVQTKRLMLIK